METYESKYRRHVQSTSSLVVAFFDRPEDYPGALENVRCRLAEARAAPDRSCILYRTRCVSDEVPRVRVWSQPVPFEALRLPEAALASWVGLDRGLKRPMTEAECKAFFGERRYEVLEIRVSTRAAAERPRPLGCNP